MALFSELATIRNEHRVPSLEALAKHYEHRERNYAMALEFTEAALALEPGGDLSKRRDRLSKKKGQTLLRLA